MSLCDPANENVTEQNRNEIITQGPIRPNVCEYPATGPRNLRFQCIWYARRALCQWLKYSISTECIKLILLSQNVTNFRHKLQKTFQLLGDFVPQTPYRGSAPGPRWGTSVPQTPCLCTPTPFAEPTHFKIPGLATEYSTKHSDLHFD